MQLQDFISRFEDKAVVLFVARLNHDSLSVESQRNWPNESRKCPGECELYRTDVLIFRSRGLRYSMLLVNSSRRASKTVEKRYGADSGALKSCFESLGYESI
ncbi:hypothetical protein ONS95_000507 [Cadophora gregata]|uniref:uncharacterized protein n=1 Tax=Cadophora gregata TaxID=51156 RepID=UPI0026DD5F60|nr:uncharacterized protein ONS95_000507 [Cadophora gregata]KAK0125486.1 hypothetical protein ONS96_009323 [Cadophora gregata f. sp. sojae]KAK0128540.1 hypothetical protein ONS95_000507 [Cadophora gregata]